MRQQQYANPVNWQGMPVYARDGSRVGIVRDYDPRKDSLEVQKVRRSSKEVYLPLSAVSSVRADGITLRVSKDAVSRGHCGEPAAAQANAKGETILAEVLLPANPLPRRD
jgi:hypothetical protein